MLGLKRGRWLPSFANTTILYVTTKDVLGNNLYGLEHKLYRLDSGYTVETYSRRLLPVAV